MRPSPMQRTLFLTLVGILLVAAHPALVTAGARVGVQQPAPVRGCGTWEGTAPDPRIEVTRVSESGGSDCRGEFRLSNDTGLSVGLWRIGGYSLDMRELRSDNAESDWVGLPGEEAEADSIVLMPGLDLDLTAYPMDATQQAGTTLEGEVNRNSLAGDTALFLVNAALDLMPGASCVIPADQMAQVALRSAMILLPATRLAWDGDMLGARRQLQQLLPEFQDRATTTAIDMGQDCLAGVLADAFGTEIVAAQILVAYLAWIGPWMYDTLDYRGYAASVTLEYAAPAHACQEWITYRGADGNYWVISPNQGDPRQLTQDANGDVSASNPGAAWSPDGSRLAYVSNKSEIVVINADDDTPTNLLRNPVHGYSPVWSPDGTDIAFISDQDGDFVPNVYRMKADGSTPIPLTSYDAGAVFVTGLNWSPAQDKLVYLEEFGVAYCKQPRLIDDLGAPIENQLIQCAGYGGSTPSWSPEGERLAITQGPSYGVWSEVVVYDVLNGKSVRLTNADRASGNSEHNWGPTWSPDGSRIAFVSDRYHSGSSRGSDIMLVDEAGRVTRLTESPGDDRSPIWSSDGNRIVFERTTGVNDQARTEIWIMKADGSDQRKVSDGFAPTWRYCLTD